MIIEHFAYVLLVQYYSLHFMVSAKQHHNNEEKMLRRQTRRQMKSSANEDSLQPRTERIGVSLCALRTADMGPGQCCPGVDLHCYGCNPNLIALGIPCEDQELSKIGANINGRDCFCDSSCQDFRDCCSDHAATCPELTTKKTTSVSTTTAITTFSTTRKSKNTRPPTIDDESWIFDKLFQSLQNIIDEKFGFSTKYQNFIDRLENTRYYFLNAEHNCRFRKKPYVGEPNKGKVKNYDGIFEKIDNPNGDFNHRVNAIAQGFQKYIKSYYYSAQTTLTRQGCDGDSVTPKKKGIHFKTKRIGRKVAKLIKKIIRRRTHKKKKAF